MAQPQEPNRALLQSRWLCLWLATRPGFLAASLVPVLVGVAAVYHLTGAVDMLKLLLSLVAIGLVHAGVNVLNDYYDELNGTDRLNTQRVFPFTGGSRFIQNEVLTAKQTLWFGIGLLGTALILGLVLTLLSGGALIGIGGLGLVLGWGYSAPPLRLNSRGWGELAIALGFGVLIPLGAWYVQTGYLSAYPVLISLGLAVLVANILIINQFPDYAADKQVGKHHWVIRLGLDSAPYLYGALVLIAALSTVLNILFDLLPPLAFILLLPLMMSVKAYSDLKHYAKTPQHLALAIKLTIGSMVLHGLLLTLILALN
ncbi:MAG: prenyltransferase [Thiofilum sp.]|uniref:prenyltransferase n=1 Tax=Thiofilum sp. TaxID=2212733 RepID=UPI0025FCB88B|nr:prenyltransferase [Thiofilum sp.]MBK8452450.1 prenyltransferase [Thiofilum sp.]